MQKIYIFMVITVSEGLFVYASKFVNKKFEIEKGAKLV